MSLPIDQIVPKYNGSSVSVTIMTNNCTDATLANGETCSATIQLSGNNIGTDSLNLWAYAYNGAIGSKAMIDITVVSEGYAISGNINGLSASGLILQNNGADDLLVSSDATSFQFLTPVASGGSYSVTVSQQPTGKTCIVSHGSGSNVRRSISDVSIVCSTNTYTIGGTISGLSADGLVLQNNAGDDLTIVNGATEFEFSTPVPYGGGYSVTVGSQPSGQNCVVSSGSGSDVSANVTNVSINCSSSISCAAEGDCRVFVTPGTIQGNMGTYSIPVVNNSCTADAGIDKANCICQVEGQRAYGSSNWAAWLSTSSINASNNIGYLDSITYVRAGAPETIIASPGGLLSGTLENAIRDTAGSAYTGTLPDGTALETCENWTSTSDITSEGSVNSKQSDWTHGPPLQCSTRANLYCFEKPA